MSSKDYRIIASQLAELCEECYDDSSLDSATAAETCKRAIRRVAVALAAENPAFDPERFQNAAQGRFELF